MDFTAIEKKLDRHLSRTFTDNDIQSLADRFQWKGFIKFGTNKPIVPRNILIAVEDEVDKLLLANRERRDLKLKTTGNTLRRMNVVRSGNIDSGSKLISSIGNSEVLLGFVSRIAKEPLTTSVSADEKFLITHQQYKGDTHGWHWGDYSFALIWALRMPPLDYGGMLQCVPHTRWDKVHPRINHILSERPIDTYSLVSGDVYLLRTDTTLHRTVPLSEDCERKILNMTWASQYDSKTPLQGDDRWWEDSTVSAVQNAEPNESK